MARHFITIRALTVTALAAFIVASFFSYAWMTIQSLRATAPIFADGIVFGFLDAIRHGRLYQREALDKLPLNILTHTPLSYWASYAASTLAPGAFWPLRAINLFATIGCAALLAFYIRFDARHSILAALVAPAVFLVAQPVFLWSHVCRSPDAFATLFSLAALLTQRKLAPGPRRVLVVSLFAVLAVLSKQTELATLTLILLYDSATRREWRQAFLILGIQCLALGLFCGFMQLATNGGFWINIVGGNHLPIQLDEFLFITLHEIGPAFWAACLVAVGLSLSGKRGLGLPWFLISTLVGLATVGKLGSGSMYFFDTSAALGLIVAEALPREDDDSWRKQTTIALFVALMAAHGVRTHPLAYQLTLPVYSAAYENLIETLRKCGGKVLADDASIPISLGQEAAWDDPFVFNALEHSGRWDPAPLTRAVQKREFEFVVMRTAGWWPSPVQEVIRANYDFSFGESSSAVGHYLVYRLKKTSP